MTDGIINGTGNSRYLKSVANALALYPTHESLMEALAAGTFPIDLNGINPAGWNIMGDKLDKATLLTDALCTALGLATTATPTQAMEKLRQLVNTAQNGLVGKPKYSLSWYSGDGAKSRQIYSTCVPYFVIIGASNSRNGLLGFFHNQYATSLYTGPGTSIDFYSTHVYINGNYVDDFNSSSLDYSCLFLGE